MSNTTNKLIWVLTSRDGAYLASGRCDTIKDGQQAAQANLDKSGRKIGGVGVKDEHGTWVSPRHPLRGSGKAVK